MIGYSVIFSLDQACGNIPDLFHPEDPQIGWALNFWAFVAETAILGPIIGP